MDAILSQLGLDSTFFIQFAVFAALFFVLGPVYFRPFQKLIDARHERMVRDREAAEKLLAQAEARIEEYQEKISAERLAARKDYDELLSSARKEESEMLGRARDEAKKITQSVIEEVQREKLRVRAELEKDVDSMSRAIADSLLARSH